MRDETVTNPNNQCSVYGLTVTGGIKGQKESKLDIIPHSDQRIGTGEELPREVIGRFLECVFFVREGIINTYTLMYKFKLVLSRT